MLSCYLAAGLDPFNERARIRINCRMKGKELEIDYLWDVGKGNEMKHEISLVLLKYSFR